MTLDTLKARISAGAGAVWGRPEDASLPLDMRVVRQAGAMLWLVGTATLVVLGAVWPPTAMGDEGWVVLGTAIAVALALVVRRLALSRGRVTLHETLGSAYVAVLGIAALEWLAGGRGSPYHLLFVLPLLFVPAVHSPRGLAGFLAVLGLAVSAPLAYEGYSGRLAAETVVQLVMLLCVAAVVRALFLILRRQSAALRRARDRAEQVARRDPLTGLGNRLAFEEAVDVEVARARRDQASLSLIVADLDNFKAVNDELGHITGDRLLRGVADCLRATARRSDECFRWGGDEFVVLLPRTEGRQARQVAGRIEGTVASTRVERVPQGHLDITCAVAELAPTDSTDHLLARADDILTAAKLRRSESQADQVSGLEA